MIAYVTSIGEPTTELCLEVLKTRFETVLIYDKATTLWEKLKVIYEHAQDDFVRVDADVIPNKNLTAMISDLARPDIWWLQFLTFDWFKLDVTNGGVQLIKKEALPYLRKHIDEAIDSDRPESYMYRIDDFHNPRRCITHPMVMGLHGYGQENIKRIYETKAKRNQLEAYDFMLAERLKELCV